MHREQCRGVFVAPTFPDYVPHGAKTLQRQIQDNLKSASQNLSVLSTRQERLWHKAANPWSWLHLGLCPVPGGFPRNWDPSFSLGAEESHSLCGLPLLGSVQQRNLALKISKTPDNKHWQSSGERGMLAHSGRECKLVQPLWKSVWGILKTTQSKFTMWPSYTIMGHMPKGRSYCTDICSALFTIARMETT